MSVRTSVLAKMHSLQVFTILVALAFALKAPFAAERFRLLPDAVAYLNIARHIASGDGYVSSLKLNYFDASPVTHCALYDWPPLYPLLAGLLTASGVRDTGLQIANALLCSVAAGLVFLIASRLFGRATAVAAGLFCAVSMGLFRAGLTAMSDPLGLVLALCAVLAALTADHRCGKWLVAGVLAGLSYLARYPNGILLPILCGYALASHRSRRGAAACAVGFIAAALPPHLCKWLIYGSPMHSAQLLHYTTASFRDSSWLYCEGRPSEWSFSVRDAWRNTKYLATNLFRTATGLQFLSVGLANALVRLRRGVLARGRGLILVTAIANFAVYALTPSLPAAQGARFLLLTYCLLLPTCAEGAMRLLRAPNREVRFVGAAVGTAAIAIYVSGYTSPLNTAFELRALDRQTIRRITSAVGPSTVIASNNPWIVWYHTGSPTAALPRNLGAQGLRKFEREYGVGAYVVLATKRESETTTAISADAARLRILRSRRALIATPPDQPAAARGVLPREIPAGHSALRSSSTRPQPGPSGISMMPAADTNSSPVKRSRHRPSGAEVTFAVTAASGRTLASISTLLPDLSKKLPSLASPSTLQGAVAGFSPIMVGASSRSSSASTAVGSYIGVGRPRGSTRPSTFSGWPGML